MSAESHRDSSIGVRSANGLIVSAARSMSSTDTRTTSLIASSSPASTGSAGGPESNWSATPASFGVADRAVVRVARGLLGASVSTCCPVSS